MQVHLSPTGQQRCCVPAHCSHHRSHSKDLMHEACVQEFETRMLNAKNNKDKGIAKREHDRLRAKATVMLIEPISVQQAR